MAVDTSPIRENSVVSPKSVPSAGRLFNAPERGATQEEQRLLETRRETAKCIIGTLAAREISDTAKAVVLNIYGEDAEAAERREEERFLNPAKGGDSIDSVHRESALVYAYLAEALKNGDEFTNSLTELFQRPRSTDHEQEVVLAQLFFERNRIYETINIQAQKGSIDPVLDEQLRTSVIRWVLC